MEKAGPDTATAVGKYSSRKYREGGYVLWGFLWWNGAGGKNEEGMGGLGDEKGGFLWRV